MTKQKTKLPPGWPKNVPLPTLEEAEEAVRKIGETIKEFEEADKKLRKDKRDLGKSTA